MGTELAARDEKAFNDLMQPMCDALRQQVEAFKNAPPGEQNKMIAAFVVENLTTGLILKGVKLTVAKTSKTAARVVEKLAQASKAEELATTAEGIKIPARIADDAMVLEMEAEKTASTSMAANQAQKAGAKVESTTTTTIETKPSKQAGKIEWTNHGFKHVPPKNLSWKEIVKSTKIGNAKYHPSIDIEKLERFAWENGMMCTNDKPWKVMKFDYVVGAKNGLETCYVRIECSANTIHGHPITTAEYALLLK